MARLPEGKPLASGGASGYIRSHQEFGLTEVSSITKGNVMHILSVTVTGRQLRVQHELDWGGANSVQTDLSVPLPLE